MDTLLEVLKETNKAINRLAAALEEQNRELMDYGTLGRFNKLVDAMEALNENLEKHPTQSANQDK
jgi:hypothetical protein